MFVFASIVSGLSHPQVSGKSCIVRGLAVRGLERVKMTDMAAAFEKYGTVTNVKFMDDRNADAIVEFQRIGEAAEAVSHLHGTKLKNRTIEVQLGDRFMQKPRQAATGSIPPGVNSKSASSGRSTPAVSGDSTSAASRDRSRSDKIKQEPPRKVKAERPTRRRAPVKEERQTVAKPSKQSARSRQTKPVQSAMKRQQVVESESEQEEDESLSDDTDEDGSSDSSDSVCRL